MIAAEQTGRRAFALELHPKYVDTAIRRWQEYTGERAVHSDTGHSFDETERLRAACPAPAAPEEKRHGRQL